MIRFVGLVENNFYSVHNIKFVYSGKYKKCRCLFQTFGTAGKIVLMLGLILLLGQKSIMVRTIGHVFVSHTVIIEKSAIQGQISFFINKEIKHRFHIYI